MTADKLEILCIGNALVDVFVQGDEQLCVRLGISEAVQHVEIEKLHEILNALKVPTVQKKPLTHPEFTTVSGGGAANVAKIAGLLGAKAGFIGALGRGEAGDRSFQGDEFGRLFENDLSTAGVKLYLPLKSSPTGLCLFLRAGSETYIIAAPSAALKLSESDISEEELKKAGVVVIDGFMLDRPGMVDHILRLTDRYGTTAAIDLSSAAIAREKVLEILDYARQYSLILFMNDTEAEAFCEGLKARGIGIQDLGLAMDEDGQGQSLLSAERRKPGSSFRRICTFFQALTSGKRFPIIVVKLGERGAFIFSDGTIMRAETTAKIPGETTGAGDAFCAAFLTAWVRNKPLSECAALGNKAARIVLNAAGTQVDGKALQSTARQLK